MGLALAIILTCVLWAIAGYEYAMFKIRRRGMEVDRDVTPRDLLPIPPAPIIVPDTPAELFEELSDGPIYGGPSEL